MLRPAVFPLICSILFFCSQLSAETMPIYTPEPLKPQTLTSVGSDSMGGLMQRWIKAYAKFQPEVIVQASSKGSASAPPALIDGSADLGPMAREMKSVERNRFLTAYGFSPTQIQVAFAAVGVYVSMESPLKRISVDQLRQIFVKSEKELSSWSQISGVSIEKPITRYGQIGHPYLSGYFRQKVLFQNEFSDSVLETASPAALYQVLEANPGAIGFAAFDSRYPSDKIRMLEISEDDSSNFIAASNNTIADGRYPLSRSLNIYLAREPNTDVETSLKDFLSFILSSQGQKVVLAQGLIPLSAKQIATQLELLD